MNSDDLILGIVALIVGIAFYFVGSFYNDYTGGLVGTAFCWLISLITIHSGLWFSISSIFSQINNIIKIEMF